MNEIQQTYLMCQQVLLTTLMAEVSEMKDMMVSMDEWYAISWFNG